jgi:hypothetical protein
MPITQSATAPASPTEAPTGEVTSPIENNYDESGFQEVESGVFDFDQPEEVKEPTPFIENLDQPAEPVEPKEEPVEEPKPAEPAPKEEPKEEKLYADKYKTIDELENAYIELGGDPAKYKDRPEALEEAYQVRQSEFSRSRSDLKRVEELRKEPVKSFQEILSEEMDKYDPATFASPVDMWNANKEATAKAMERYEQQVKTSQITPQEMDHQIKTINELKNLETKVPRLTKDAQFRNAFAYHVEKMKQDGTIKKTATGTFDLTDAFKNFMEGQKAVVEEASKVFAETTEAKTLSTATSNDNSSQNPASAPRKAPGDDILDGLIEYHNEQDRKYN